MMIFVEIIETSVTITDYLQSQLLRSTLTWKIKLRGPEVLLCSNYSLFNTSHKSGSCEILKVFVIIDVHVPINRFANPFAVQNDLLITFSLCHSSARDI